MKMISQMGKLGFILTVMAAFTTAVSNLTLRAGVLKAGGFGATGRGLTADMIALLKEPLFVVGVFLYGVAALIWFRILSTEDMGTGYVLLVSMAFLLVTAGGILFFKETMSVVKFAGICLILCGIVIVAKA